MDDVIDLRSDTVTRPSAAMREAIAAALVGDDQFGEDPTINRLQDRIADMLGKEAALWFPTGTMSNQTALRVLTRPGDDVIASWESHAVWHETGASAANSGVQFTAIGEKGVFTREEFLAAIKPRGHVVYPPTTGREGSSSRKMRRRKSARPLRTTVSPAIWMGPGCGIRP
jgi:threonine aldolase